RCGGNGRERPRCQCRRTTAAQARGLLHAWYLPLMGLDVHDVGDYKTADGTRNDRGLGKQRLLEPGMVFTVEPGLYFASDDFRVPKEYRGIGIRIEDDLLITADGNEVLTAAVPKTVDEIERLMAGGR